MIQPRSPQPIKYLPTEPIGEIRIRYIKGIPTYFWYYNLDGKQQRKYLSRDKARAIERHQELSDELINGNEIMDKPEYSGFLG
jgi:hypothetical protein